MNFENVGSKDLYYTNEHEWINFQGTIAYVGICGFKLTGFKEIHDISFVEPAGFMKQGEIIATITYAEYQVDVQMPVDGKLQQLNEELISGNENILLKQSEGSAWIAMIIPASPYERTGLLMPKEYRLNGKGKYAK